MNYGAQSVPMTAALPEDTIPTLIDCIRSLADELDSNLSTVKTALTGECEPKGNCPNEPTQNNVSSQLTLIRAVLASAVCSKNRICQKLAL